MKKDSMIIYRLWKEVLLSLGLSPQERCRAYEAIMDYAFDGIIPEDKETNLTIAMMRVQVDKDQSHYNETCNKRADAGRLGGIKSAESRSKNKQKEANEANASKKGEIGNSEANPSKRKQNEHEYEYEYDNDNEYKNNNISVSNETLVSETSFSPLISEKVNPNDIDFDAFLEMYNRMVAGTAIPSVRKLDDNRKRNLKSRAKEYDKKSLKLAIELALESDFLSGRESNWHASFDWIFAKRNFIRILEGNYANRTPNQQSSENRFAGSGISEAQRMANIAQEVIRLSSES